MSRTIGIDLGTTNTAVAVVVDGRPKVLEDEKGYKVLPSCVSSKGEGRYIVGLAARSLILSAPERTVYAIKRLMGRRWDAPEVENARERVSYEIEAAPDGGVRMRLGNESLSPPEISAILLQVAQQIAERALGERVEEAVITVPAYFTHAQRQATLDAARMAGLRCHRLLNEPTAAALAYGYRKDLERTVVVFDLGGGTFDVCILRISGGYYEIMATRGDSYLGGEDFDFRLVDHLADAFQSQHGVDLRQDRSALQRLKDAAERAKCELSFTDRTTLLIPRISGTSNLEMVVSRATLESLVDDLVARTLETTRRALTDAGLAFGEIDDVILVGGQTRMPKIREAVSGLFGREPNRSVHPEEVVAIGAAIHAASLEEGATAEPILLDVTPFDLGIDAAGGLFTPILQRNTKIPASRTRTFATVHDNQDRVRITVRQGEALKAQQNEFLGEFLLEGIRPAPRMEARVNVTFRLDSNGMLHVQAADPATGERKQITIRNYADVANRSTQAPVPQVTVEGDQVPPSSASGSPRTDSSLASGVRVRRRRSLLDVLRRRVAPSAEAGEETPATSPADGAAEAVRDVRLVDRDRPEVSGAPPDAEPPPVAPQAVFPPFEMEESTLLPLGDEEDEGDIQDYGGVEGLLRYEGDAERTLPGTPREEDVMPLGDDDVTPLDLLSEASGGALPFLDDEDRQTPMPEPDAPLLEEPGPDPGAADPSGTPEPPDVPEADPEPIRARKPARVKMTYRSVDALGADLTHNLARGGAFVHTRNPVAIGRACVFEVSAPGLTETLILPGVVRSHATEGSPDGRQGMWVDYRFDDQTRKRLDALLAGLRRP
ncbi:MAG: Hsp70 family protein [Deltaproteobacteria bacterium]|nr:Hsp70 family protein [Deltaproteobacteria bacterium]